MTLDLYASATEQIAWLERGDTTSADLLEAHLQQYEAKNPGINAVIATDIERARAQAADMDQRRAAGEPLGPLCGLPMTIKDTFDVDGLPAVCGSPALASRPKQVEDAVVVARLKAAGAIIWGKTNTPLFAGDAQTYNEVYGVTHHPTDNTRSPGGSSGGSAAAVASGMTPIEVGSDIAGSLRNPAHSCGVCSLKPSWGVVPTTGHVPPPPGSSAPEPDLAVVGPMARCVADLKLVFSLLAPDASPGTAPGALSDLRVAMWQEPKFPLGKYVAETQNKIEMLAKAAGAHVTIAKPDIDPMDLLDTYLRLLIPIVTAGMRARTKRTFRLLGPVTWLMSRKGVFSLANMMRFAIQSPETIAKARQRRDVMKTVCKRFFDVHDVLIAPVLPTPALPHNNSGSLHSRKIEVDGQRMAYTRIFDWIALASHCHLPVVTLPISITPDGLPIGLQFIGPEGSDRRLLDIAELFEAELKHARAAQASS